jgi:hypothetical protein
MPHLPEKPKPDKRSHGRQNKVTWLALTESQWLEQWSEIEKSLEVKSNVLEDHPFSACKLWTGSTQNGYAAISQGHAKSKLKPHLLACWKATARFPEAQEVASHRCHRKLCCNPAHLTIESIHQNNIRKGCMAWLKLPSGEVWRICPHHPRCLRRDTDNTGGFTPTRVNVVVNVE